MVTATGMVTAMGKNDHDKLVKQLQDQIFITGSQVKQKMQLIQKELLEEIRDEHDKGTDLR